MSARLGRRPNPEVYRRGGAHYLAALRATSGVKSLAKMWAPFERKRPTLHQTYQLIERVDALLRALEVLTLPEGAELAPRTAASISAEVAAHGRAMAGITSGWRACVPDLYALSGARRLSTALCRSIAALEAIERQHDTEESPDEYS